MRSGIYLISLLLTSSLVNVLVQRILNYYPTHRLYFGEIETPYCGFQGAPMMPRGGSLSVGCTPDHCSPSCLGDVEKLSVCLFFFFLMTYDRDFK